MSSAASERRRERRVELTSRLQGQVIALDEPVFVQQLSDGGMTLHTRVPLPSNVDHEFRVDFGADALLLRGQVRHARVVIVNDEVTYVTGVQFIDAPAGTLDRVRALLESDALPEAS
ncbi:MAG: PilZ domain-containing protein [Vicinamibacterales bacterium]